MSITIIKTVVVILLFLAIFLGFQFLVRRISPRRTRSLERQACERAAAFDTLIAAGLWLVMFDGRFQIPPTVLGLNFSLVYVLLGGAFYFASLAIRLRRKAKHASAGIASVPTTR